MPDVEETYRGAVVASECDVFGHLNIAFYPARFEAASAGLLERLGVHTHWHTLGLDTRYLRELRAGEGLVIRSFVLASEGRLLRLAHEARTPSGERSTLITSAPSSAMIRVQVGPATKWVKSRTR